jgi:hypothetical protein
MSLAYREVRKLDLAAGMHPRELRFLSAASGLVRVGETFYVVADDELHLGVFSGNDDPLRLLRLLDGELPAAPKPRKAVKPDLETLLYLPPSEADPGGSLLALGSGSRPNRFTGALVRLDRHGEVDGAPRSLDLVPLFGTIASEFESLNIEGGFVSDDALFLLQRGGGARTNAVARFELAAVRAWLRGERADALHPLDIRAIDLGDVQGVPFGFTDASALGDGSWLFSAVAERTGNSYDDGPCVAAAIGRVGRDGDLRWIRELRPRRKVEGIVAQVAGSRVLVSMVTDADDPDCPAELGTTAAEL